MSAVSWIGRNARKVAILIVGTVVLLAGVAMLALPGPGMIVIILGLVILAQEFDWAQRWLDASVERAAGALGAIQDSKGGRILMGVMGVVMIIGGIVVSIWFTTWIIAGISFVLAGAISLATLHPKVQAWIDEKALTGIDGEDSVPAR